MNFDKTETKFHPYVNKLREEFRTNTKKPPDNYYSLWFCLKEEKRMEYIKEKNIYPSLSSAISLNSEKKIIEEESNLLNRLKHIQIENEYGKNPKTKEKTNFDKEKKNATIQNSSFELKAARKTGAPIDIPNFKNKFQPTKNEKEKRDLQKKSESLTVFNNIEKQNKKPGNQMPPLDLKRKKIINYNDLSPLMKKIKK